MLRDVLVSLDGFTTWPCDEINYIWRHGNVNYPSDALPISNCLPSTKNYINGCFKKISKNSPGDIIVEKTCANSLRVNFVDKVFPEAKYLFIYRNGLDVIGSAKLKWVSNLDLKYILKKARFVPFTDIPYYAIRYLWFQILRFFSPEKRISIWGPIIHDMKNIKKKYTLTEICGLQWKECVERAEEALSNMPKDKVMRISYEDFVHNPSLHTSRILKFLNKKISQEHIRHAVKDVTPKNIGKGELSLTKDEIIKLKTLLKNTIIKYGYTQPKA